MDAHDIFKKLTRGVIFTKKSKNTSISKVPQQNHATDNKKPAISGDTVVKDEGFSSEDDEFMNDSDEEQEEIDSEKDKEAGNDSEKDEEAVAFSFVSKSKTDLDPIPKKKIKTVNPEQKKKQHEEEELNHFRNSYKISVKGKRIPEPLKTFDELEQKHKVPVRLIENLAMCGYPLPTPIQMQAIPIMLQGRSLMACAPTGSGKTVAFLLPVLRDLKGPQKKGFRAIILAPTRELAQQIHRECLRLTEKTGLKAHIISKVSQAEQKFGEKSNKKYDILVSTPNRVCYLLGQDPPVLDFSQVEWFVVDEADKLLEEGVKSFKDQFDQILAACTNSSRKVALFSATYTVPVAKWAIRNLKGLIRVAVGARNAATDTVQQDLLFVGSESGKLLAFRDLVRGGLQPPVLVFVQSKDRAKQLFSELIYDGINVDVIHADRTQKQRDNCVKAFREGKIWVLICTELMGRGIDFKGVNLVVNYDFPPTSISYIHRIGRTGRAGRPGRAITYFTQDDTNNLRSIAHIIKNSGGQVPDFMLTLKKPKKSDKKKLANRAPERDEILTVPQFQMKRNQKLRKLEELNQRKKGNDGDAEDSMKKKKSKIFDDPIHAKKKKKLKDSDTTDRPRKKRKEKKNKKLQ